MIKSFRGKLTDGGQDRIYLATNNGRTGYRIVKFAIFFNTPGSDSQDSVVQIWKEKQTTIPTSNPTVDFSDNDLLAVGQLVQAASVLYQTTTGPVIFDNEIINQDIYVTHTDSESAYSCNYYFELEVIDLSSNSAEYVTLKDVRGRNTRTHGVMP